MNKGNGSKVDVLPRNTCSRKYIWNLKVIVAKQRAKAYNPLFYKIWNNA